MKTVVHREKQGIKVVFSPNFGPHGSFTSSSRFCLTCALTVAVHFSSLKQSLLKIRSRKSYKMIPSFMIMVGTQFCSLYKYTQNGYKTGFGGSNQRPKTE
jgi:hypothetical protein